MLRSEEERVRTTRKKQRAIVAVPDPDRKGQIASVTGPVEWLGAQREIWFGHERSNRLMTFSSAAQSALHDKARAAPRHEACNKTCSAHPLCPEPSRKAENPEGRPQPRANHDAPAALASKPHAKPLRLYP